MKRAAAQELMPPAEQGSSGLEARLSAGDHLSLRLWLRLLSCSTDIEAQIRKRLRQQFGMSLARFDTLAQLHRHPQGLRMNALSRCLMVTGGNVTGLTDELQKEGLVARTPDPDDRRAFRVSLTAQGRQVFERCAGVHEAWVAELLDGLSAPEQHQLHELLGRLRQRLSQAAA